MAREAQRRLRLLQQAVVQPARFVGQLGELKKFGLWITQTSPAVVLYLVDEMRGVALVAGNPVPRVLGVFEEFLLFAGDVAGKTARGVFGGGSFKSEEREVVQCLCCGGVITVRCLDGIGMSFRWAVAALAPVNVILSREDQLGVAGFSVLSGYFLVAGGASFRPCELTRRSCEVRRVTSHRRALRGFGALLS